MDRVIQSGYRLPPGQTMKDVLAISEDLLRGEGIDPTWTGLAEPPSGD